ncbi:MAG: T9SS type A sorting domain-containing protein [Cyclonatronaceae bacterium]
MSGDHWINNGGWLVDRVDTWNGITTQNVGSEQEPEWRVTRIVLSNNMTQPGSIPPEIGDLEYLADIELRGDPALFGEWPMEIENLVRIFEIRTQDTNMSGEIPWESLAKTGIQRLRLQAAKHFGEIPDQIFADMPQLQRIEISDQFISGSFPSSITQLTNLRRLRLQGNLLTGDIPDLGHIARMEQFHVNGNPLNPGPVWPFIENWGERNEELRIDNTNRTGTVPEFLGTSMFAMVELTIGEQSWDLENAIGGEFPDLSGVTTLQELHIHGPHWDGGLPDWIGNMNMNRIYFFYCSFSGDIPASYANVANQVQIHHCPEVTGGIPAQFQLYSGAGFVLNMADTWNDRYDRFGEEAAAYYRNTQMQVGNIPTFIGNWGATAIQMSNVGLTGEIPNELLNNTGLQSLNLSQNPNLTGSLPAGLLNLPLSTLNVSHTGLSISEIPAGLSNLNLSLNNLGMAGLGMTGEIPLSIGDFPLMNSIDLSGNNLTGSIPSTIGNLSLLTALNLSDNQLSGELPAGFADIGFLGGFYALNSVDLSGNENLEGEIPLRFSEAELMRVFRYENTQLRAPNSPVFADWLENVIPSNADRNFPAWYVDVNTSGLVSTSIEHTENPYVFYLSENYPNPFNPATSITYQIPHDGQVRLDVFNVLGQQVASLVDEVKVAGRYETRFDARALSSGVYLYRLTSGGQVMTRKMVLVK